jgi:hypothetical protein
MLGVDGATGGGTAAGRGAGDGTAATGGGAGDGTALTGGDAEDGAAPRGGGTVEGTAATGGGAGDGTAVRGGGTGDGPAPTRGPWRARFSTRWDRLSRRAESLPSSALRLSSRPESAAVCRALSAVCSEERRSVWLSVWASPRPRLAASINALTSRRSSDTSRWRASSVKSAHPATASAVPQSRKSIRKGSPELPFTLDHIKPTASSRLARRRRSPPMGWRLRVADTSY